MAHKNEQKKPPHIKTQKILMCAGPQSFQMQKCVQQTSQMMIGNS